MTDRADPNDGSVQCLVATAARLDVAAAARLNHVAARRLAAAEQTTDTRSDGRAAARIAASRLATASRLDIATTARLDVAAAARLNHVAARRLAAAAEQATDTRSDGRTAARIAAGRLATASWLDVAAAARLNDHVAASRGGAATTAEQTRQTRTQSGTAASRLAADRLATSRFATATAEHAGFRVNGTDHTQQASSNGKSEVLHVTSPRVETNQEPTTGGRLASPATQAFHAGAADRPKSPRRRSSELHRRYRRRKRRAFTTSPVSPRFSKLRGAIGRRIQVESCTRVVALGPMTVTVTGELPRTR